jgi:DNA-binding LytR/AlgR family response regulator
VKPVELARLAETVARLQGRLTAAQPAANTEALLQQLARQLQRSTGPAPLRWIRAQIGQKLRLIPVDDIDYLRSDAKYTVVAWRGDADQPAEVLVRTALKDLVAQLDETQFAQIHRGYVVNLRAIGHVVRADNETATVHLKGRREVLPVSRGYLHLFRQM